MKNYTQSPARSVGFDDYEEFVGGDTDEETATCAGNATEYPCECLNDGGEDV